MLVWMVICDQIDCDKINIDIMQLEATPVSSVLTSYSQK